METPHDEPSVRIGMREIYDVLLDLRSQLALSVQQSEARDREVASLSARVNELEDRTQEQSDRFARWRYMITSAVVTGGMSLATVLARVLLH